ncbi:MAG TPA: hypothetical protein VFS41_07395 [Edaphobacter sp.]|nr:hypothetical protein [Edaphobacter sp.]
MPAAPPVPAATVLLVELVLEVALFVAELVPELLPVAALLFAALAFLYALEDMELLAAWLLLELFEAVASVARDAFALFDAEAFADIVDPALFDAFAELERLEF